MNEKVDRMDPLLVKATENEVTTNDGQYPERDASKEEIYRIEKDDDVLQYNVLDRPPFLLIISLALQVRKFLYSPLIEWP